MFFKINPVFKYFAFTAFLLFSVQLFAAEKKEENWIIAVSEFEFKNPPASYALYQRIVPQMFLTYLNANAKRLEPLEEKRARAVAEAASNRLKLIKERAKLINDKDNLFFSIENEKSKAKKIKNIEKQIKRKEKEIEKAYIDVRIAEHKFYPRENAKTVSLWRNGESVYKVPESSNMQAALKRDKISALISGEIKNSSGYLIIKARLDTGLKGVKVYEFTEGGRYEDAELMVQSIAAQIYTVIQNTKEVKIYFDVTPANAKLYIDGDRIEDFSKPLSLYQGKYYVEAFADDYIAASKKIELKDKDKYKIKINLQKENTNLLAFNLHGEPNLFFKTKYYGSSPVQLKLPYESTILEFENGKAHTYVLFDKRKIPQSEFARNMIVKLNQKETKELVERQRKVMYWSLAAFYVVLPTYLILDGVYKDKKAAFADGRLEQTDKNYTSIRNMGTASSVMQGVAITAGINYFIQLIVYLVYADRAIPRTLKQDYKAGLPAYIPAVPSAGEEKIEKPDSGGTAPLEKKTGTAPAPAENSGTAEDKPSKPSAENAR